MPELAMGPVLERVEEALVLGWEAVPVGAVVALESAPVVGRHSLPPR